MTVFDHLIVDSHRPFGDLAVGFGVAKSVMAPNLTHCQVTVADRSDSCDLIVSIKTKPALQIGDKLFKLEEFEI